MPKLTIITLTYNHEKFISKAIESFLAQKVNFDFEVIISDDCSTDQTPEIIKKYAEKYPNVIKPIFHKQNVGSMNNFIDTSSMVSTEYVAYCDGDDYWTDENKLQKQVDFLENNHDYTICFHQTKVFFDDKSKDDEIAPKNCKDTTDFADLVKESYIPANTVVYRWQFGESQKLSEILPRDITPGDYFIHLYHAQNGKVKFMKEVMSDYRRHSGGVWWLTSQLDGQDEFYLKNGYKYLNFFKFVEKYFNLSEETYMTQKQWLVQQTMKSYINSKKFEELVMLKKENTVLFEKYINDFDLNQVYYTLPRYKKLIYLLFIDNRSFKDKINKIFKKK